MEIKFLKFYEIEKYSKHLKIKKRIFLKFNLLKFVIYSSIKYNIYFRHIFWKKMKFLDILSFILWIPVDKLMVLWISLWIKFKRNLIKSWNLSFRDSYYLAFCYLEKFPKIIKILQKGFQYVFVDEMQDMEQYQVDILEKLFYKKLVLNHCFQRIWDKNQAIY